MGMDKEPRRLEFSSLQEVEAEARRLHEVGYEQIGNWDLAQTCGHLEDWMRFPVEGFPNAGFPMNLMLWGIRNTMGKSMIRKIFAHKSMKPKNPTMPQTVKQQGALTEEESLEGLAAAIRQFSEHSGEYHDSPVFGKLNRKEATDLQLIHCAHHLGFLIPREN